MPRSMPYGELARDSDLNEFDLLARDSDLNEIQLQGAAAAGAEHEAQVSEDPFQNSRLCVPRGCTGAGLHRRSRVSARRCCFRRLRTLTHGRSAAIDSLRRGYRAPRARAA